MIRPVDFSGSRWTVLPSPIIPTQQTALNKLIPEKKESKALNKVFFYVGEKIWYFICVYNVYSMWTDFIQLGLLQLNKNHARCSLRL